MELPHTSFRMRHDELLWKPVYVFVHCKQQNVQYYGIHIEHSSFHRKYINNLISPATHTHAFMRFTYLQYLRCSLAERQQWRRSWIQQAAVNARPGTAVQARVVTGHCRSIFPCVNPTLSAFTSAPVLVSLHCFSHS